MAGFVTLFCASTSGVFTMKLVSREGITLRRLEAKENRREIF